MDFTLPPDLLALRDRTRRFIDDIVIPRERHMPPDDDVAAWDGLRAELQAAAREAGVFLPHLGAEWGGLGLSWVGNAVIFEEAGRSALGIQALNCAAPDEGNMHLIEKIGTPAQRERYLRPLAAGTVRSCFGMTEPPPGAGADPSLLQTRAERRGSRWVINGRKHFISGASGAAFCILMARTDEVRGRHGATMFLIDATNPGFRVTRRPTIYDRSFIGGHCEITLEDCEVGDDAVLGAVHQGFDYAQVRLRPARLTHCMRWLGAARRATEHAMAHALGRHAFGTRLADNPVTQSALADCEIDLHSARLMIWHAAWLLDQGQSASHETAIAKVAVSEAVNRVADRCIQICGAQGISEDLPLANLYRETRAFRIYDGPSEVHRMSIAKRLVRRAEGTEREAHTERGAGERQA
ncbi:MAG: acyl-CoA dehydrogenase family protein [Chloroflexi bacterium OHK40]